MNDNFLCKCGHRNKLHIELLCDKRIGSKGRLCAEYRDAVCIKGVWYHNKDNICSCNDFEPDNLKYLESKV